MTTGNGGAGVVIKIEDVDNPFPYGLALVRLLDRGRSWRAWPAVLAFNGLFQLVYIYFWHSPAIRGSNLVYYLL